MSGGRVCEFSRSTRWPSIQWRREDHPPPGRSLRLFCKLHNFFLENKHIKMLVDIESCREEKILIFDNIYGRACVFPSRVPTELFGEMCGCWEPNSISETGGRSRIIGVRRLPAAQLTPAVMWSEPLPFFPTHPKKHKHTCMDIQVCVCFFLYLV